MDFSSKAAKMMLKMGWAPGTALAGTNHLLSLLPLLSSPLLSPFSSFPLSLYPPLPSFFFLHRSTNSFAEGGLVVPIEAHDQNAREGLGRDSALELEAGFKASVTTLIQGITKWKGNEERRREQEGKGRKKRESRGLVWNNIFINSCCFCCRVY